MTSARPAQARSSEAVTAAASGGFDAVLCFGAVDWWYHNRGHFDLQLMRRIAGELPVLYVNSLAMRVPRPSEGSMFLRRIRRKLGSLARGLRAVEGDFHVLTAAYAPGPVTGRVARPLVRLQIRRALRRLGARRPAIWVTTPTAYPFLRRLPGRLLVYNRTDRYEEFPGVDRERIARYDRALKTRAYVTVYCSASLLERERAQCARAVFLDHAVDFERFAAPGEEEDPPELRAVPRPRAGFVGALDAHTFDPDFFLAVARRLPEVSFVLVGGSTLPEGWAPLPNVHRLGQKPYEEVPAYARACDVLFMTWRRSPWIEVCNPVKLREYLATGRPVVSTPFEELRRYEGAVHVAGEPEAFAEAIRRALAEARGSARAGERQALVRSPSWSRQADRALDLLREASAREGL